jgi:DNA-binding response OmpR family regulator
VLIADDKPSALAKLDAKRPDLVVCDVNGDTLDLLDAVRRADGLAARIEPDTPLIVLTAHADELARVRYFDRGCDDVVAKPFSYLELRARVRALLRRSHGGDHRRRVIEIGALRIDTVTREVRIGETTVALSAMEYALLTRLAGEPTRVFTKAELLRDVWGFRAQGRTRTLDSHACRLRHKLTGAGGGHWIENIWGIGYRLAALDPHERCGSAA